MNLIPAFAQVGPACSWLGVCREHGQTPLLLEQQWISRLIVSEDAQQGSPLIRSAPQLTPTVLKRDLRPKERSAVHRHNRSAGLFAAQVECHWSEKLVNPQRPALRIILRHPSGFLKGLHPVRAALGHSAEKSCDRSRGAVLHSIEEWRRAIRY